MVRRHWTAPGPRGIKTRQSRRTGAARGPGGSRPIKRPGASSFVDIPPSAWPKRQERIVRTRRCRAPNPNARRLLCPVRRPVGLSPRSSGLRVGKTAGRAERGLEEKDEEAAVNDQIEKPSPIPQNSAVPDHRLHGATAQGTAWSILDAGSAPYLVGIARLFTPNRLQATPVGRQCVRSGIGFRYAIVRPNPCSRTRPANQTVFVDGDHATRTSPGAIARQSGHRFRAMPQPR